MAEKILNARTQQKHDIEANWDKATNFIPKAGEIIVYDEDAAHSHPRMKIGDGTSYLADLEFLVNIDTTLTKTSAAADAKTVGDAITSINTIIENFDNIIAVDENNDGNVVLKRYNADGSEDPGGGAAAIHAEQHAADGIDPITPEMIGAMPANYTAPVTSVNGMTGDVTIATSDPTVDQIAIEDDANYPILFSTGSTEERGADAVYFTAGLTINPLKRSISAWDYEIHRFNIRDMFPSLLPDGTAIPENTDLNTNEYLGVGNYYCSSNSIAETLINCPTSNAFMMRAYHGRPVNIDDEDQTHQTIRRILTFNGEEYIQSIRSTDIVGEREYGPWQQILTSSNAVTSVNGKTGVVELTADDVGALPNTYEAPVASVNSMTGEVVLTASDVGALSTAGGTATGNIIVASDTAARSFGCKVGDYDLRFMANTNGNRGLYDNVTDEWLLKKDSSNNVTLNGTATKANAVAATAVQIRSCGSWSGEIAKGGYSSTISITPTAVSGYRFLGPVGWGSNSSYTSIYGLYYYNSQIRLYTRNLNENSAITPTIDLYGLYTKI